MWTSFIAAEEKVFTDVELQRLESRAQTAGMGMSTIQRVVVKDKSPTPPGHEMSDSTLITPNVEVVQTPLSEFQSKLFDRLMLLVSELQHSSPEPLPPLKGRVLPKLNGIICDMNVVLGHLHCSTLCDLKNYCYCAARVVIEECGISLSGSRVRRKCSPPW